MKTSKGNGNVPFVIKFVIFSLVFGALAVFMGFTVREKLEALLAGDDSATVSSDTSAVVVIDAGHGGEDGGCSGGGLTEKELNLAVSGNLRDLLSMFGVDVMMTRTEDKLLYDMYGDLKDYTGHKKTYDLRNRLRFSEDSGAALTVSVHMNKFTDPKYSGLQVYYSPNTSESKTAAELMQSYTAMYLQPENKRQVKKATSSIYLLDRIRTPAVMVECGFLSNEAEAAKLGDAGYRRDLSVTLLCAVLEYLSAK